MRFRFALTGFALAITLSTQVAVADVLQFTAELNGANVVPKAVETTNWARVFAILDTSTSTFTWSKVVSGVSGFSSWSFHGPAALGESAPMILSANNPTTGQSVITPQQAADLTAGLWYVNVVTLPPGSIRGQLVLSPVLHDNGPLVTHVGNGPNGSDTSQSQVGPNTPGGAFNFDPFRMADDFTIPAGSQWAIEQFTFFEYQTNTPAGDPPVSTILSLNLRIWSGLPGEVDSTVVFGDTTTDRLTMAVFSNVYRTTQVLPTSGARPVMCLFCRIGGGLTLGPGTYWVDWQAAGSLGAGPFVPYVTIAGQPSSPGANARQLNGGQFLPYFDPQETWPQDMAFIIGGTSATTSLYRIPWHSLDGGGSMFMTGGNLRIGGSLAQWDAGPGTAGMTGGALRVRGGFWPGTLAYCALPGDMNNDGLRNGKDIQGFVNCLTGAGNCKCADTNASGTANAADISTFIGFLML